MRELIVGFAVWLSFFSDTFSEERTVFIHYGKNLHDVDLVAEDLEAIGIQVVLQENYENPKCGRVTVGSVSAEFDQYYLDTGGIDHYVKSTISGRSIHTSMLPTCTAKTNN